VYGVAGSRTRCSKPARSSRSTASLTRWRRAPPTGWPPAASCLPRPVPRSVHRRLHRAQRLLQAAGMQGVKTTLIAAGKFKTEGRSRAVSRGGARTSGEGRRVPTDLLRDARGRACRWPRSATAWGRPTLTAWDACGPKLTALRRFPALGRMIDDLQHLLGARSQAAALPHREPLPSVECPADTQVDCAVARSRSWKYTNPAWTHRRRALRRACDIGLCRRARHTPQPLHWRRYMNHLSVPAPPRVPRITMGVVRRELDRPPGLHAASSSPLSGGVALQRLTSGCSCSPARPAPAASKASRRRWLLVLGSPARSLRTPTPTMRCCRCAT
jgi:hypothetical protein